jgi:hypothetical protein
MYYFTSNLMRFFIPLISEISENIILGNANLFILNLHCLIHANDDNDFNVGDNRNWIKLYSSVEEEAAVAFSSFLYWITSQLKSLMANYKESRCKGKQI